MATVASQENTYYQPRQVDHVTCATEAQTQSQATTQPRKMQPYYGYGPIAEFCELVICTILETPVRRSQPGFISLRSFVAYALYRTRLEDSVVHMALILIARLKAKHPRVKGTASSPHRLFLAAAMLSAKMAMDDTYSNRSWQIVARSLFSLQEVNQIERELLCFLGWNIWVTKEDLADWQETVLLRYREHPSSVVNTTKNFCTKLYLANYKPADPMTPQGSSPQSPTPSIASDDTGYTSPSDSPLSRLEKRSTTSAAM